MIIYLVLYWSVHMKIKAKEQNGWLLTGCYICFDSVYLFDNMKLVYVYGSSFTSDEFQSYVKFNGIFQWRTAPYKNLRQKRKVDKLVQTFLKILCWQWLERKILTGKYTLWNIEKHFTIRLDLLLLNWCWVEKSEPDEARCWTGDCCQTNLWKIEWKKYKREFPIGQEFFLRNYQVNKEWNGKKEKSSNVKDLWCIKSRLNQELLGEDI